MHELDHPPFNVVIVDDNAKARQLFKSLLKFAKRVTVVGEATDGLEAQSVLRQTKPDVALIDINMPNINGIDLVRWMTSELPQTKALMLSSEDSDEYISQSLNAGASGYALKNVNFSVLLAGINDVRDGKNIQRFTSSKEAADSWQNRSKSVLLANVTCEDEGAPSGVLN